MSDRTARISRRGFLGGSAGLLVLGSLPSGCGGGAQGGPKIEGDLLTLGVDDGSELATVGGYVVVTIDDGFEVIVARTTENDFVGLSALCTHRQCEVEYQLDQNRFYCPCHGSTFDETGAVTWGPATEPLVRYPTEFDGKKVQVDLSQGPP